MNIRNAAAPLLALVLAIAVGAIAYTFGTQRGVDRATVEAMVRDMAAASKPAPAMTPAPAATMPAPGAMDVADISDSQRTEIEGVIRNYLIANPEIIRDAINELQRKEDEAARVAQTKVITDNASTLFDSKNEVVLGNPKGDVTLVEFFDYNCAYCRRAHADMQALIKDDPNLRVVLKEFPILGDGSVAAAQVAVAVLLTAPDKYAAFHEALITEKGQVDGDKALAVAADLGLDAEMLKTKANSDEAKANINEVRDLAEKLDLTGTPSYATKLKVVVGAVGMDNLKAEIKAARACADIATC
ncbi:MAG TPA: DsbA family protein [Bauldia sp.]|nr:DsbA family protein [Bauldia sp.]